MSFVSKVYLKKSQVDYFRKLARNNDKEILAYLVGEVISKDSIRVDYFAYPTVYEDQTKTSAKWTDIEYYKLSVDAYNKGKVILGDLHTHPEWDAVMSPQDYEGCMMAGLIVCGICSVRKRKTYYRIWNPNSALPCDVVLE